MSAPPPRPRGPRALLSAFGGGLSANFWKLWASTASANLADGITLIAIPLIAVGLTRSPAEIAGVAIAAQIPMVLLGLVAGGLADRLDRRWTMLAVQLLRVAVIGGVAILALAGAVSMPVLYVGAFIIGAGEAFFDTNAQSILPALVGRDRLVTANGRLFAAETIMNSFVGPPVGGLLVAIAVPLALAGAAAGYALAAIGLLLLSGSFRAERAQPSRRLAVEIGEGIAYLLRHRLLLTLSGMVALGRLGSAPFFALLALYAVAPGPMGLSEPGYGLLLVTFGVGSLVGSVITGRAVALLRTPRRAHPGDDRLRPRDPGAGADERAARGGRRLLRCRGRRDGVERHQRVATPIAPATAADGARSRDASVHGQRRWAARGGDGGRRG